jgi:hypothetical protein
MAKYSAQNSIRGACYENLISKSALQAMNGIGESFFVDGTNGVDTKDGGTWKNAKKTIASAVTACAAGDTIYIKGTAFSEAVTCSKAGVKFIGVGTGPAEATWTHVSATTVTTDLFCLKIAANGVVVDNIKFRPVAYIDAGTPTGIYLDEGSDYSIIRDCRFQGRTGSYNAIYGLHPVGNITIEGCEFLYMNTHTYGKAIYMPAHTGIACSTWQIRRCIFNSCIVDIDIDGRSCLLEENIHFIVGLNHDGTFASAVTVQAIDLSGTDTGANVMTKCTLGGTYNLATYKPGAVGDVWRGNYASIVETTAPNGLSVLVPAA